MHQHVPYKAHVFLYFMTVIRFYLFQSKMHATLHACIVLQEALDVFSNNKNKEQIKKLHDLWKMGKYILNQKWHLNINRNHNLQFFFMNTFYFLCYYYDHIPICIRLQHWLKPKLRKMLNQVHYHVSLHNFTLRGKGMLSHLKTKKCFVVMHAHTYIHDFLWDMSEREHLLAIRRNPWCIWMWSVQVVHVRLERDSRTGNM